MVDDLSSGPAAFTIRSIELLIAKTADRFAHALRDGCDLVDRRRPFGR
jgi:hypothetical protein